MTSLSTPGQLAGILNDPLLNERYTRRVLRSQGRVLAVLARHGRVSRRLRRVTGGPMLFELRLDRYEDEQPLNAQGPDLHTAALRMLRSVCD